MKKESYGGKNPKMERKSTMMGVSGGAPKKMSVTGATSRDVSKNREATGPSILKKKK